MHSYLKDESGAIVAFHYQGVINVTEGVAAVLGGKSDAKTTPFGDACEFIVFRMLWGRCMEVGMLILVK